MTQKILKILDGYSRPGQRKWKDSVQDVIRQISPRILNLSDADLTNLFEELERAANQLGPETITSTHKKTLLVAVLAHFNYSHNMMRPLFQQVNSKLFSCDLEIVEVLSDLLRFLANETPLASQVFKSPLASARTYLRDSERAPNAILILTKARKHCPQDVATIIENDYKDLLYVIEDYSGKTRKRALKLLKFYVLRETLRNWNPVFTQAYSELDKSGNTGAMEIIQMILEEDANCVESRADELIQLLVTIGTPESYSLVLQICAKVRYTYDCNTIIMALVKPDLLHILENGIRVFGKRIDKDRVVATIKDNIESLTKNACCMCVYQALLEVFGYIEPFLPARIECRNYVKCVMLVPEFFTKEVAEHYEKVIRDAESKPEDVITAIMLFKKYKCIPDWDSVLSTHMTSSNIELRKEVLNAFSEDFIDGVLAQALYDISKEIRVMALSKLLNSAELAPSHDLLSVLGDSSFKVRRKAIECVGKINELNLAGELTQSTISYTHEILDMIASTNNSKFCAKYASLLPVIAMHWPAATRVWADAMIDLFIEAIDSTASISQRQDLTVSTESSSGSSSDSSRSSSLSEWSMSGSTVDDSAMLYSEGSSVKNIHVKQGSSRTSLRDKVRMRCQAGAIDRRDTYFVEMIAEMGALTESRLDDILRVFEIIFRTRLNESILFAAANALTVLSRSLPQGLNIRTKWPRLTKPLCSILVSTTNENLSVQILKLFGSAFDYIDVYETQTHDNVAQVPNNMTEFVCENLATVIDNPSMELLLAFAQILESDPQEATRFLSVFYPLYCDFASKGNDKIRGKVFWYMQVLVVKGREQFVQLLPETMTLVYKFLGDRHCLDFCSQISHTLGLQFREECVALFTRVAGTIDGEDAVHFRSAIRFLAFCVLNQGIHVYSFISSLNITELNKECLEELAKWLVVLIQRVDVKSIISRIAQIVSVMAREGVSMAQDIIFALYQTSYFTEDQVRGLWDALFHKDLLKIPAVPHRKIKWICPVISRPYHSPNMLFRDFHMLQESEYENEIRLVMGSAVANSPCPVIRACQNLGGFYRDMIRRIGHVAFYTCWDVCDEESKKHTVAVTDYILRRYDKLPNTWLTAIQLMDRAGIQVCSTPMTIVQKSDLPQLSLYFVQKEFLKDPTNPDVLRAYMNLNLKMGHMTSLRAIYKRAEPRLSQMERAEWLGYLGDWNEVYKIYKTEPNVPMKDMLLCLRHLGQAKKIMADYEDRFLTLKGKEKADAANSMAWSYFHTDQQEKCQELIEDIFKKDWSPMRLIFSICYQMAITRNFEEAKDLLELGFRQLAADRNVVECGDQNQLNIYLSYVQLMTESQEVYDSLCSGKRTDRMNLNVWRNRVGGFKRNQMTWERIITLRNFALPFNTNMAFYVKILSTLRNEKRFGVIDQYFTKYYDGRLDHISLIERCKIDWACNRKIQAANTMQILVNMLDSTLTPERFRSIVEDERNVVAVQALNPVVGDSAMSDELRSFIHNYFNTTNDRDYLNVLRVQSLDVKRVFLRELCDNFLPEFYALHMRYQSSQPIHHKARVYRIYGLYYYRVASDQLEAFMNSAKGFFTSLRLEPGDARSWRGWGYANARLFALSRDNPIRIRNTYDAYCCDNDRVLISADVLSEAATFIPQTEQTLSDVINDINFGVEKDSAIEYHDAADVEQLAKVPRGAEFGVHYNDSYLPNEQGVDVDITNHEIYGINTISAFVRATYLHDSNAFEYLTQMFATMFAMPDPDVIPEQIRHDILRLPARVLMSFLPQVNYQLAHPRLGLFIQKLLLGISREFFEALYFSLSVYTTSSIPDKQRRAVEIINEVKSRGLSQADDIEVFADGMIRCAITIFESWKKAIEDYRRLTAHGKPGEGLDIIRKQLEVSQNPRCELDVLFRESMKGMLTRVQHHITNNEIDKLVSCLTDLYGFVKDKVNRLSVVLMPKIAPELAAKRNFKLSIPGEYKKGERISSIESVMDVIPTQQHPRIVFMMSTEGVRYKYLLKGNEDLRNDERLMQFFSLVNTIFGQNSSTRDAEAYIIRYTVVPLSVNSGLISWVTGADTYHHLVSEARTPGYVCEQDVLKEELHADLDFALLNHHQKYEVFERVSHVHKAHELFEIIWKRSLNAPVWMKRTQRFTVTSALMSMVGYVIGLGDRHPSNIMIQRETGNVVHIDFGEAFESTLYRREFPEKVPFRLTRMIQNAVEGSLVDGYFTKMCRTVLGVMRINRWSFSAILNIFVNEPLHGKECGIDPKVSVKKMEEKLQGKYNGEFLTVREQVRELVQAAANPMNYVQHYPGWCPFW